MIGGRLCSAWLLAATACGLTAALATVRARAAVDDSRPPPVHLDAIVTDKTNRPVRNLSGSDFEVIDAGESMPIESVSRETSKDGRVIALFLDEYHVASGEPTARVRTALTAFVNTELQPGDVVALMKPLDALDSIQLTTDRSVLLDAISRFDGRKGDYQPRGDFEENFMSRAAGPAAVARAQVVASALQALALKIGTYRSGRKALILASEGFSPALPHGSDRLTGRMRAIEYAANRYQVALYPVDPEIPVDEHATDTGASMLKSLADHTAGEATFNKPDFTASLKQAVADLNDYYLVSYQPAKAGDGKFHAVELRVNRPGLHIRTRSGYWSARADLLERLNAPVVRKSLVPARPVHSSLLIRPWFGTSLAPDGRTNVTVAWEAGTPPPRSQRVTSVELKATTSDGAVLFDQPLDPRASFVAEPGVVNLEMTIHGADGRTLDSDYRQLQIPDLKVTKLTFATLEVMRTLSAREFATLAADPVGAPVSSRIFSRIERLLLRLPVYGIQSGNLSITATLTNRTGTPIRGLTQVPGSLPANTVQFDLPLSFLPPDDYRVELRATSGDQQAVTVLQFRVTD